MATAIKKPVKRAAGASAKGAKKAPVKSVKSVKRPVVKAAAKKPTVTKTITRVAKPAPPPPDPTKSLREIIRDQFREQGVTEAQAAQITLPDGNRINILSDLNPRLDERFDPRDVAVRPKQSSTAGAN